MIPNNTNHSPPTQQLVAEEQQQGSDESMRNLTRLMSLNKEVLALFRDELKPLCSEYE